MANSVIARHNLCGLDIIKPYPRFQALHWNPISKFALSNCKHEVSFWSNLSTVHNYDGKSKRKSFIVNAKSEQDDDASPSEKPSWSMRSWMVGMVVSLILPSFTHKLSPIWVLKSRIDNSVQMVEDVAEAVESVAEEIDKIAEHIAGDLPDGKLKKLVSSVEIVAEKTAKTAGALDDIIDRVQDIGEEVESIIESIRVREAKRSRKQAKSTEDDH